MLQLVLHLELRILSATAISTALTAPGLALAWHLTCRYGQPGARLLPENRGYMLSLVVLPSHAPFLVV